MAGGASVPRGAGFELIFAGWRKASRPEARALRRALCEEAEEIVRRFREQRAARAGRTLP